MQSRLPLGQSSLLRLVNVPLRLVSEIPGHFFVRGQHLGGGNICLRPCVEGTTICAATKSLGAGPLHLLFDC